jgi:hypothetical protein
MSATSQIVVGAAVALTGSGVGARTSVWLNGSQRRARRRKALEARITAYITATDRLAFELDHLPSAAALTAASTTSLTGDSRPLRSQHVHRPSHVRRGLYRAMFLCTETAIALSLVADQQLRAELSKLQQQYANFKPAKHHVARAVGRPTRCARDRSGPRARARQRAGLARTSAARAHCELSHASRTGGRVACRAVSFPARPPAPSRADTSGAVVVDRVCDVVEPAEASTRRRCRSCRVDVWVPDNVLALADSAGACCTICADTGPAA